MKTIPKRQAMAIYRQHPQSRLFRFCTGNYKWSGSICHYHGREVQDNLLINYKLSNIPVVSATFL